MKNLKKVLALAVAFVMCFTMFAGALVFTDVPAGGDYSAAITLLSDLGVVAGKPDGSFGINDAITRADAACLIARLMTGEQNPPKYNNAPVFSDVVPGSYYESSVGYCAALGITSGTGNGQFSPSKTITDGEFVAMLTRALGYDTPEHPLQWPMGNIVVAQQKGLLKNVNIEYASDALRGEDAQMLANALFADYDRWAAQENLYQRADDRMSPTIAEIVFNLGRMAYNDDYQTSSNNVKAGYNRAVDFFGNEAKRVYNDGKTDYEVDFDCQAHTWVIAGVDATSSENTYVAFAISDDDNKVVDPKGNAIRSAGDNWAYQTFTYTGDITPYIGYQVELWGEMDHPGKTLEVAAIRTIEGQKSYDYNASMEGGNDDVTVDDTKLKLKDAETGYANLQINTKNNWQTSEDLATGKYDNNRDVAAVYNLWKGHEKKDRQHVNGDELLRIKDGDQFKLFDWDDDGDLDFVVKNTAKYAIVEDVTAKRVVVASIDEDGKGINSRADQTADNTSASLKLGESDLVVNADGVEEGDIVEITVDSRVYTKADDEVVTITLNKVEPDTHKLTRVSTKGTLAPFFDGEEFFVAEGGFWDLTEAKDPEDYKYEEQDIKRDFDLFLDRNGFIVYSRYSNGDSGKYMMVLETQEGGGRISAHHLPAIKALLENDKVQTFDVVENLKITGPNGETDPEYAAYNSNNYTFTESKIVGRVYKYYTNAKGQINKLVAATHVADDSANRYKTVVMEDYSYNEKSLSIAGATAASGKGRYNLETAKAVFVVDTPLAADTNNAQTYIREKTVDGLPHLYVDPDDVIAVDPDDIPNIDVKGGTTPAAVTLAAAAMENKKDADGNHNSDSEFDQYSGWLNTSDAVGLNMAAILGYTNSNRDVNVAILGVDKFEGFGRNAVKLGILSRVDSDASEKDDEYVYTFHLAIDGKETAEFKSDSVEGLDDIVSRYKLGVQTMTSKNDIDLLLEQRGLAYVEVRFDGDLVDEVVVMESADGGKLYQGEYYTVTRAVVGPQKITNGIQFNEDLVTYATEKKFSSITNQNASAYFAGLTADTNYYAINERPTIKSADKPYEGKTLLVTRDFAEDYAVKGAEKADIGYSVIYNDDRNLNDEYYVVDIATEKPGTVARENMNNKDAVAVVIFEKSMDEGTGFTAVSNSGGMTLAGSNLTTVNDQDREHEIQFNVDDLTDVAVGNVYAATSAADSTGNVSAEIVNKSAVKITVKAGAAVGKYDVVVTSKEYGDYTITVIVTEPEPEAPSTDPAIKINNEKSSNPDELNLRSGNAGDEVKIVWDDYNAALSDINNLEMRRNGVKIIAADFFNASGVGKVNSQYDITYVTKDVTPAGEYTLTIRDSSSPRDVFATYTFVVKEWDYVMGGYAWAAGASLSTESKLNVQIMLSRDGSVGMDGTGAGHADENGGPTDVNCLERATFLSKAELEKVVKTLSNADITLVKGDKEIALSKKAIEVVDFDEAHVGQTDHVFYGRDIGFLRVFLAEKMTSADNGDWVIKIDVDGAVIEIGLKVAGATG